MSEQRSLQEEVGLWLWFVMPHSRETDDREGLATWDSLSQPTKAEYLRLAGSLLQEIRTHDPDMVPVERSVLVELLWSYWGGSPEYGFEPGVLDEAVAERARLLIGEVESGARDRLTAAEFAGSGE